MRQTTLAHQSASLWRTVSTGYGSHDETQYSVFWIRISLSLVFGWDVDKHFQNLFGLTISGRL